MWEFLFKCCDVFFLTKDHIGSLSWRTFLPSARTSRHRRDSNELAFFVSLAEPACVTTCFQLAHIAHYPDFGLAQPMHRNLRSRLLEQHAKLILFWASLCVAICVPACSNSTHTTLILFLASLCVTVCFQFAQTARYPDFNLSPNDP